MYLSEWFGRQFEVYRVNEADYLEVARPAPNVLAYRMYGHLHAKLALDVIAHARPLFNPQAPLHVFHDWRKMTGYDTQSRSLLTEFVRGNDAMFGETSLLVRSPLVALGVSTANLILRHRIAAYKDQSDFLQAYHKVLGNKRQQSA